jgi:hypothetical protein
VFITDGVPSSSAKAHCTYSRHHLHPAGISITSPLSIHGHMGGKPCLVKLVMTSPFSLPPLIHLCPLPVSSSLHAADLLLIPQADAGGHHGRRGPHDLLKSTGAGTSMATLAAAAAPRVGAYRRKPSRHAATAALPESIAIQYLSGCPQLSIIEPP